MMSDEVPTTKREKPMIEKQLEVARQNWEEWLHAVQNGHYGLAHHHRWELMKIMEDVEFDLHMHHLLGLKEKAEE